jgi:hypothetical protein
MKKIIRKFGQQPTSYFRMRISVVRKYAKNILLLATLLSPSDSSTVHSSEFGTSDSDLRLLSDLAIVRRTGRRL